MGIRVVELINQAAAKIGVGGRGKTLAADELFDWLVGLKQMLDGWALEELMIPFVTRETFALTGQQSFSIGPGADFDTERPMEIRSLEIIDEAGENYRVAPIPLNSWNLSKDDVVARPRRYYYEDGLPHGFIRFDRIPYDPTLLMVSLKPIEVWQVNDLDIADNPNFSGQSVPTSALSEASLHADVEFDHGYESCIVYNLAVYMASDYGKTPTALVFGLAESYKARIKGKKGTIPNLRSDGFSGRGKYYDIVEGPGDQ